MAKTYLSKQWKDLNESEKRSSLWDVICNRSINFKQRIDETLVIEIIKKTKDNDFFEKADSIREEVYQLCLTLKLNSHQLHFIKKTLRMEE